jgi:hypothetical protein
MLNGWKLAFLRGAVLLAILAGCIKLWDTGFCPFVALFSIVAILCGGLFILMWIAENISSEEPDVACRCRSIQR